MSTTNQIALQDYQDLLKKIQKEIKETGEKIAASTIRQKVEMCWQLGKLINENISQNSNSGYGENLFEQLEKDLSINQRTLYRMQGFYKSYPTLPKNDANLNWSHYRVLAQIKNNDKREYLEHLVIENSWSSTRLIQEVKNIAPPKISDPKTSKPDPLKSNKKITPIRGQLFAYPLVQINQKIFLDLGFSIFKEIEEKLPANIFDKVQVNKEGWQYSFSSSALPADKFNSYKAYLDRVVDGDTIRVTIDLGFKILHKEIIRLKAIDAPEGKTPAGKESTKFMENIFKDVDYFTIKTIKNDIYGRYVADVFLPQNKEMSAQQIADEGIYLNQILLDSKMAVILN